MYVGSVYWFLSTASDLFDCRVTIWDCTSEKVVWDSGDCCDNIPLEADDAGFGDYEICSYDIWAKDGKVCIEINIEMDEEDE